ncbi:MAG: ATP-binding protein [Lachnospiraceae bacterium]|nr:ATP-binding protein [Lachnospiraceae bacterium]
MQFDHNFIGSNLMEIITSGLYDGNLNCVREYVQNSIDAKAKCIDVYFENEGNDLIIKDNGRGMDKDELTHALGIGLSNKSDEDVGWRGIGIWSGVPVCKRIVIITKKEKHGKYRIEIKNNDIRSYLGSGIAISDILTNSTGEIEEIELGEDESLEKDHYSEIRLENILNTQRDVFTNNGIKTYMSHVLPSPLNDKDFSIAADVDKWLEQNKVYFPDIQIKFNGDQIFRPPTKDDLFFPYIIRKLFEVNGEVVAVGWFMSANKNEKLESQNKGIFFKKKGFTIGNESLVKNLHAGTYHEWQYGEIHIISKNIIENAARNNFELNSGLVSEFLNDVGDYVKTIEGVNQYQSKKNIGEQVSKAAALIDKGDIPAAKKELDKLDKKIKEGRKFPSNPEFEGLKKIIDDGHEKSVEDIGALKTAVRKPKAENQKLKAAKEYMNYVIEQSTPAVKKSIKRATTKGRLHPEMCVTDPLRDTLCKKTGINGELYNVAMTAYGAGNVGLRRKDPLLTLGNKNNPDRDARFGVALYFFHDIFVNVCKHEKGTDSFKWYEEASEEEQYYIMAELYATISLLHRIIEKSEEY